MRPAVGLVLVGWLCFAGAAFFALFDHDATDDFAGWVPAIVGVQVPAFVALWPSRRTSPLSAARRWALVLPAALVTGLAVFWMTLPILALTPLPDLLALAPLFFGLVAMIAAASWFGRILRSAPHPRGARRVLIAVVAIGTIGVGMTGGMFGHELTGDEVAMWLVIVAPVAWALPLWALAALEPPREPPIPRVIVAR